MFTTAFGTILLLTGAMLLAFGIMSADSVASSFSRLFTGNPSDKTAILLIVGVIALGAGIWMTAMARES